MHPVSHAKSSASRFGGRWQEYLPFHAFLDQSKACAATAQHRVFLHSIDLGMQIAAMRFGPVVRVDSGPVRTQDLFLQHMDEDLGCRASLDLWLYNIALGSLQILPADMLPERLRPFRQDPLAAACQAWGGTPDTYRPLLNLLKLPERCSDMMGAHAVMQNSLGIFIAEQCLGVEIQVSRDVAIPTRIVAERFVEALSGQILAASEVVDEIPLQDWMMGPFA